jgi:hypothetical protein
MDQPKLLAEFIVANGVPQWVKAEDGAVHFSILLRLVNAPPDTITVIYQLDDSYLTPIRLVPAGVPDFQEGITACGDFEIRVAVRKMPDLNDISSLLSVRLSDALSAHYQFNPSDTISKAILDIREHWVRNDRRHRTA